MLICFQRFSKNDYINPEVKKLAQLAVENYRSVLKLFLPSVANAWFSLVKS